MLRINLITIGIILIIIIAALLLVLAGSQNSIYLYQTPLFAVCGVLIFMIQWLAFIPSYIYKTEKHFDLIGSLTYITMVVLLLTTVDSNDIRAWIILIAVAVWAIRLGAFLFKRILSSGSDTRFDNIKTNFLKLLMTWTLQGLWVFVTFSAGIAALSSKKESDFGTLEIVGTLIFLVGFSIEIISDKQKTNFKKMRSERFIETGLWKYSRHPNYLGEILIWVGIAFLSINVLAGWQYFTLISPVFVAILLTKISGIPMLETKSDAKWGHLTEYQKYKKRTPVLIPNIIYIFKGK